MHSPRLVTRPEVKLQDMVPEPEVLVLVLVPYAYDTPPLRPMPTPPQFHRYWPTAQPLEAASHFTHRPGLLNG